MRRYSEADKANARRRMGPLMRQSMAQMSTELGIHVVTLHNLRKRVTTARRGGFELAAGLFGRLPGSLQGRVPFPTWQDEDSHSPRFEFGVNVIHKASIPPC
jgi:hypothetical protein